ncbi:helix-turn-helix domain-containing protein [Streptomyces sp. NPDC048581]|uniref:helix-turn-helix domain-containing protein n=1 Tax=unclassified Streptomyces TaxID=2593676 RepID=UPI003723F229
MVMSDGAPTRTGGRPYHHGNLRAVLLESAERALRAKGADALSLRELDREAGVSPRAPVRHFRDKPDLLNALVLMDMNGWDTPRP